MRRARRFGGPGFTGTLVVLFGLLASAIACQGEEPQSACTPGESAACACDDGGDGAQSCRDDGSGFEECVCRSGENGSSGDAGAAGENASGSGSTKKMGSSAGSGGDNSAGAGGNDAGSSKKTGSGGQGAETNTGAYEYGEGDYGLTLSEPESEIYCWIIEKSVSVCNGTLTTDYTDLCVAREKDCFSRVPKSTSRDQGDCYFSTTYQLVSGDALTGTCEKLDAYWDEDPKVDCLFHSHCGPEGRCVDYQCVCPEGIDCNPAPPPPPPPPGGGAGSGGAGPGSAGAGPGNGGAGGSGPGNGGPGNGGAAGNGLPNPPPAGAGGMPTPPGPTPPPPPPP